MSIGLGHYLVVAAILFTLGIFGIFLNRKNVIVILMSIELILLAVNLNLVAFSAALGDLVGQVFAMFVLTVAAAEAAREEQTEEVSDRGGVRVRRAGHPRRLDGGQRRPGPAPRFSGLVAAPGTSGRRGGLADWVAPAGERAIG